MYEIYVKPYGLSPARNVLIFKDDSTDEDMRLIKPKLVLEDNEAGSLEFTIPHTHKYYDNLYGSPLCGSINDTVTVYKNGEWYWEGRPCSEDRDFYNQRKIHCEGALNYLKDTIQPMNVLGTISSQDRWVKLFLIKILNIHNTQLSSSSSGVDLPDRKIYIEEHNPSQSEDSVIDVEPKDLASHAQVTNYETTLETINKRFIEKYGGHIRVRRNSQSNKLVLDYIASYNNNYSQEIEFGKNLLDFTTTKDLGDIATVIIPLGDVVKSGDEFYGGNTFYRNTPSLANLQQRVNLGFFTMDPGATSTPIADQRLYASTDVISNYGYIEKTVVFDKIKPKTGYGPSGWESIDAYRNSTSVVSTDSPDYREAYLYALKIRGENYLNNAQFENLEITISAFDLSYLGVSNVSSFELLDKVYCSSRPHGMTGRYFPITKMEIALDSVDETVITLNKKIHKPLSKLTGTNASIVAADPNDFK